MKSPKAAGVLITLVLSLAACASSAPNLRRETATSVGNTTPDQVKILNVHRGFSSVDWKAATPKGNYSCFGDDMLHHVGCKKD